MGFLLIGLLGLLLLGQDRSDGGSREDEDDLAYLKRTDYGKWKAMKDNSERPRR